MYIMYVCLFCALSRRVGALQISIIIIIKNGLPAFVCVSGWGGGGGCSLSRWIKFGLNQQL